MKHQFPLMKIEYAYGIYNSAVSMAYIKPIAISFTDAEDRLTEQKEMFKLGEQTCKKKMQAKLIMEQYAALKRFILDIDVRFDLRNLENEIYAGRYVISAKNLVNIMDDQIVSLNKKIADLKEDLDIANEQANIYIDDLDKLEKTENNHITQIYILEGKYANLLKVYKKEKDNRHVVVSNNKNVKHLIVLFYAMVIYICINIISNIFA